MTEVLESRVLLSAEVVSGVFGTGGLSLDPELYDPSSILVRYETARIDAAPAAVAIEGTAGSFVVDAGAEIGLVPGLREVALPEGVSVEAALRAFQNAPNVLYVEPNYTIQLAAVPNDPRFDELWGLNNTGQTGGTADADIDAVEGWEFTTGTGSTVVAVIDTGVDYLHEDLAANIWVNPGEIPNDGIDNDGNGFVDDVHGYDFANNDPNPMDDHNHGTHVAGTIGAVADNRRGVAGINWNATIMAVKFITSTGSGTLSDAIGAINYAVENGARISNNSWGFNGGFSQALFDAVERARDAGHIFVAAAGNGDAFGNGLNNDTNAFYPANFDLDNVVAVAATDHNDEKATFSNFGETTVDVGAPGVGILSTTIGDTYSTFSGTSMATPHTAGVLSLLLDQNPDWDYLQPIERLYETVDLIPALDGITVTGGRINAEAAVGPDVTGPRVVETDPGEFFFDPFSSIRLRFNEVIDPVTFTKSDVLSFSGPNGSIAISGVEPVAGTNNRAFDVQFAEQSELGTYTLVIDSEITDLAGNPMDQDQDGINGESVDDRFTLETALVPFFANLDFGTSGSPVAAGFRRVDPLTVYDAEEGFGWESGTINSRDRGSTSGDDLTRDFNITELGTFQVDVPVEPAIYSVKITMGDALADRDEMGVFLEGILFGSVSTAPGEYNISTYEVTVSDGQLTLTLEDLGGDDPITVINAVEIDAIGPDTLGPRVLAADPSGEVTESFDRITLSFSEAIDGSTFTTADVVSLSGPSGAITPTGISKVTDTSYAVLFDPQTELGDYSLTVGPEIADVVGNLMDQNDNGIKGEDPDDRFTTAVTLSPVPPFEAHYDFGTTSSPVATGYTRVAETTAYSTADGFGWQSGTINSRDRGATYGDELVRDFNFTEIGTFAVDVPDDGIYEVTITMGDGLAERDLMGISLEGIPVDSVTSPAGVYVTNTYQTSVTDGQLTLLLEDLGGDNALVMINSLDVRSLGPDTAGPRVTASDPAGEISGTLEQITLTFNEQIDGATFTTEDVALSGPNGAVAIDAVNALGAGQFEVLFAAQETLGDYVLTVGPGIADTSGNLMDQDGDGINGETADAFSTTVSLVPRPPLELRFDFGTGSSPVATGYTRVAENSTYSAAAGFGWTAGSIASRDRGSAYGTELQRDLNLTTSGTFAVDVLAEPTLYDVTFTMGDGLAARDEMGITIEGVLLDVVSSPSGGYVTNTYRVSVADGQLTLLLEDLGGSDTIAVINGLDIIEVGPDTIGPQAIGTDPSGETTGTLEQIAVTFNEAIDPASFTVEDIVSLSGPAGAITPSAVTQLAANVFAVEFAAQSETGDYSLTIGPEIDDAAGNAMDQDGDGAAGESPEDRFSVTVTLVGETLFEKHFDFGTSSSPVAAGYEQVTESMSYAASRGFGWLNSVISRDRGAAYGNELERDFNATQLATFVIDVPAGDGVYDVTVTMGDGLATRDEMGVFIEGELVGTLTAPAGTYAVETFRVTVSDGQMTVLFDDLGGSNGALMINGMDIVAVPAGSAASLSASSDSTAESDTDGEAETVPRGLPAAPTAGAAEGGETDPPTEDDFRSRFHRAGRLMVAPSGNQTGRTQDADESESGDRAADDSGSTDALFADRLDGNLIDGLLSAL